MPFSMMMIFNFRKHSIKRWSVVEVSYMGGWR